MANRKRGSQSTAVGDPGRNSTSRLSNVRKRKGNGSPGWDDFDHSLLAQTIERVTRSGALISFSRSSDGGAASLYIKDGDEEDKSYFAHEGEMEPFFLTLYEEYE